METNAALLMRDYLLSNTRAQPVPAQVRQAWATLRLPLPLHCLQGAAGWTTDTFPFPPQTRHEIM
jgi:hypothetical protein